MIRCSLFNPDTQAVTLGHEELIEVWRSHEGQIIWIDMEGSDDAQQSKLLREFEIHELAIQDALRHRHPPKTESFEKSLFILLRGLDAETTTVDFDVIQLALFVGEGFFITRHNKPSVSANALWQRVNDNPEIMARGPATLALSLSRSLAKRYVEILLELEPRLDAAETEMFVRPNDALLAELTGYKSRLRQLARIGRYHQHVVTQLRQHDSEFMPISLGHELTDLYEKFERTQSLADLYYQMVSDLTDGYLALASHKLNNVMQILTIFTVLFVPLTFIAGIYGMNFENIPELRTENGYFIVIGLMLVLTIGQLLFFRRKKWL